MHSASVAGALGRLKAAIRGQVSVGLRSARVAGGCSESFCFSRGLGCGRAGLWPRPCRFRLPIRYSIPGVRSLVPQVHVRSLDVNLGREGRTLTWVGKVVAH